MVKYHIYTPHHLGDSVFNMILFYNIKKYIEQNNIVIFYYCNPQYLEQLKEFKYSEHIHLKQLSEKPNNSIMLWIENKNIGCTFSNNMDNENRINFNIFLKKFFNIFLQKINIKYKLYNFFYIDNDLLDKYELLNNKYKNLDILILNSEPLSGQYNYNKGEWDNHIHYLQNKYNLVTTTKVDGILCTFDDHLTIKTIAAISTRVKVIIAINSGVIPGLFNYYTLTNIKQAYTFDDKCFYSYPNFTSANNITELTYDVLDRFILSSV